MGSCISRPQTTEAIVIDMPKKKPSKEVEHGNHVSADQDGQAVENNAPNEEVNPEAEGEGEDDQATQDIKLEPQEKPKRAAVDQVDQDAAPNQSDAQEGANKDDNKQADQATDINEIEFTVANYPGEGEVEYYTLNPPNEEYVITKIYLHNFYDDELDCDFFNGLLIEYTHPTTREICNQWLYGSEISNEIFPYEVSNLDYIESLVWSQNTSANNFMTHFGLKPKMGEVQEVGSKGDTTKVIRPEEKLSMLYGLEVGRSKLDRQFFVWIKPIWKPVPESKYLNLKSSNRAFLNDATTMNAELLDKQMVYCYKKSNEIFNEFQADINPKNLTEEYLGGLPTRFLSPTDQQRLDNMLKECKGTNILKHLKGAKYHKQALSADVKKDIVNVCTALITKELRTGNGLDSVSENIRFLNKVFAAVYNDDHELWNSVKANVGTSCTEFNTIIFKQAIDQMMADPDMAAVQAEADYQDPAFKGLYQKACPQKVDEAGCTEMDDIINQYIHEAKQIIMEFHATMRRTFGSHYIGAPVKGFNRIKAKVEEYMEEEKLNASDAVAKVMDFVRGTVVSYNGAELRESLATLRAHKSFKIVRIKNGFKDLQKEAFKSILINVMAYNCMICEVQFTLKPMKTFNEISHFIYEIQREENLYNVVANHLNINQQFKSWLEPFIPNDRKLLLPERDMRWKGYIEGTTPPPGQDYSLFGGGPGFMGGGLDQLGFFSQSGTDVYLDIILCFTKDGKIIGYQDEPRANKRFKIEGTHQDYKTVDFTLKGMVVNNFKGKFLDTNLIEGKMGNGNNFRIYIGDHNYPNLSAIAVDTNFNKIRKIEMPEELIKKLRRGVQWSGYSYDINFPKTKVPMSITMQFHGKDGIGSGKLGNEEIFIQGKHENYRTFSFFAQFLGHGRYYDGVFINNYTVKGKYNEKGEMGNFEMYVTDPEILPILKGNKA